MAGTRRRYRLPGTIIKETLAAWYVKSHAGCGCEDICAEMDRDGPEKVEERLEYYKLEMKESIKKWRKKNIIPILQPPLFVIEELILYGVNTSKAERTLVHQAVQE